jgi:DNA-binding MurR/RpiR family transcriptional regulator
MYKDLNNKEFITIKIKSIYNQLTRTNKKIADFLLNNPYKIYNTNLKEISLEIEVSEAAIVKFCKFLGLKGFTELKIDLIKEISLGLDFPEKEIIDHSSIRSITNYMLEKDIGNLRSTVNNLNYKSLEQIVDKIIKAKKIILVAVGASVSVAYDFFCRISRINLNCICNFDSDNQRVSCSLASKDDVVIGISLFGESFSVVDSLKIAQKNGATTVCITSFIKSSITKFADIKLFTVSLESEFQKIDIPSRLSQMFIFDILYMNVAIKRKKESISAIIKAEDSAFIYKNINKKKMRKED